jgi:N-acetylmuramoyl-L-alanine amidase
MSTTGPFRCRYKWHNWRIVRRAFPIAAIALSLFSGCTRRQAVKGVPQAERRARVSVIKSVSPGPSESSRTDVEKGSCVANVTLERIDTYGLLANAAKEQSDGRTVRAVLWFSDQAPYRRGELPASTDGIPRRLFIDLEEVQLSKRVPSVISVGSGGLIRIRPFDLDPRTTRVSFDVTETAEYRLFPLVHPFRIIMDFREFEKRDNTVNPSIRHWTIAIDPGHGGSDFGASGDTGLKESHLTLDMANRLRAVLRASLPNVQVVLTRDQQRVVSLEERTAIANGYGADLFLSIHFNASSSPAEIGGVSTYIIDTANNAQALSLAARENGITEKEVSGLQAIVASLYRKDQVKHSEKLARAIQSRTIAAGRALVPRLADRGTSRALFYVLIGATMPSVLIEASFIARAPESAALTNERYREALARGIARGIIDYVNSEVKP